MPNAKLSTLSRRLSQDWQHALRIPSSSASATIALSHSEQQAAVKFVVLNVKQVLAATGMSRSKLYALLDPKSRYFDPGFPPKARIGARSVGFAEHLVQGWLASRFEQANGGRK